MKEKGKNNCNNCNQPNQSSATYAQTIAMKPLLEVQVPIPTTMRTHEVLALPASESDDNIPQVAMVIR